MANVSMESIEGYLAALTRRLGWAIPNDKVNGIVEETRAHLIDRADDLTASGMSRSAAEAVAVAGFGPVVAFSRAVSRSAFEDATSIQARQLSCLIGCSLLVFSLFWMEKWIRFDGWLSANVVSGSSMTRGNCFCTAAFVAFFLSAFFGKRRQTALFGGVGLLGALAVFFYAGQAKVFDPNHGSVWLRSEIAEHRPDPDYEKSLTSDVRLLTLGCDAFAKRHVVVPPELLANGAIIVPMIAALPTTGVVLSDDVLRQEPSSEAFTVRLDDDPNRIAYHAVCDAAPYRTAATLNEATQAWREMGKPWLAIRSDRLRDYQMTERWWTTVQTATPQGFSCAAGLSDACPFLFTLFAFLLLEALASMAGQHTHRMWKNGRRGSYA